MSNNVIAIAAFLSVAWGVVVGFSIGWCCCEDHMWKKFTKAEKLAEGSTKS